MYPWQQTHGSKPSSLTCIKIQTSQRNRAGSTDLEKVQSPHGGVVQPHVLTQVQRGQAEGAEVGLIRQQLQEAHHRRQAGHGNLETPQAVPVSARRIAYTFMVLEAPPTILEAPPTEQPDPRLSFSDRSARFLCFLKGNFAPSHLFIQLGQRRAGGRPSFLGPQQPVQVLDHVLAVKLGLFAFRDQNATTLDHLHTRSRKSEALSKRQENIAHIRRLFKDRKTIKTLERR